MPPLAPLLLVVAMTVLAGCSDETSTSSAGAGSDGGANAKGWPLAGARLLDPLRLVPRSQDAVAAMQGLPLLRVLLPNGNIAPFAVVSDATGVWRCSIPGPAETCSARAQSDIVDVKLRIEADGKGYCAQSVDTYNGFGFISLCSQPSKEFRATNGGAIPAGELFLSLYDPSTGESDILQLRPAAVVAPSVIDAIERANRVALNAQPASQPDQSPVCAALQRRIDKLRPLAQGSTAASRELFLTEAELLRECVNR